MEKKDFPKIVGDLEKIIGKYANVLNVETIKNNPHFYPEEYEWIGEEIKKLKPFYIDTSTILSYCLENNDLDELIDVYTNIMKESTEHIIKEIGEGSIDYSMPRYLFKREKFDSCWNKHPSFIEPNFDFGGFIRYTNTGNLKLNIEKDSNFIANGSVKRKRNIFGNTNENDKISLKSNLKEKDSITIKMFCSFAFLPYLNEKHFSENHSNDISKMFSNTRNFCEKPYIFSHKTRTFNKTPKYQLNKYLLFVNENEEYFEKHPLRYDQYDDYPYSSNISLMKVKGFVAKAKQEGKQKKEMKEKEEKVKKIESLERELLKKQEVLERLKKGENIEKLSCSSQQSSVNLGGGPIGPGYYVGGHRFDMDGIPADD